MPSETSSFLRNGKIFSKKPHLVNFTTTPSKLPVLENHDSEQSSKHYSLVESQRELEGKLDSLKGEIDGPKSLLEKVVQQNEQKNGQSGSRTKEQRSTHSSFDTEPSGSDDEMGVWSQRVSSQTSEQIENV